MKHAREDYQRRIIDSANLIPADEPVFLLRGQDVHAAETVRFYSQLAEAGGAAPELTLACERQANAMDAWRIHKHPDLAPAGADASPLEREIATWLTLRAGEKPDSAVTVGGRSVPEWTIRIDDARALLRHLAAADRAIIGI